MKKYSTKIIISLTSLVFFYNYAFAVTFNPGETGIVTWQISNASGCSITSVGIAPSLGAAAGGSYGSTYGGTGNVVLNTPGTGSYFLACTSASDSSSAGATIFAEAPFDVTAPPAPAVEIHFSFIEKIKSFISNIVIDRVFAATAK